MRKSVCLILLFTLLCSALLCPSTLADFIKNPQTAFDSAITKLRHSIRSVSGGHKPTSSISKICSSKNDSLINKIKKATEGSYIGNASLNTDRKIVKAPIRLVAGNNAIIGFIFINVPKLKSALPVLFLSDGTISEDLTILQPNRSTLLIKSIKCAKTAKVSAITKLSKNRTGTFTNSGLYQSVADDIGREAIANISSDGSIVILSGSVLFSPTVFFGKVDNNLNLNLSFSSSKKEASLTNTSNNELTLTVTSSDDESTQTYLLKKV